MMTISQLMIKGICEGTRQGTRHGSRHRAYQIDRHVAWFSSIEFSVRVIRLIVTKGSILIGIWIDRWNSFNSIHHTNSVNTIHMPEVNLVKVSYTISKPRKSIEYYR